MLSQTLFVRWDRKIRSRLRSEDSCRKTGSQIFSVIVFLVFCFLVLYRHLDDQGFLSVTFEFVFLHRFSHSLGEHACAPCTQKPPERAFLRTFWEPNWVLRNPLRGWCVQGALNCPTRRTFLCTLYTETPERAFSEPSENHTGFLETRSRVVCSGCTQLAFNWLPRVGR